MHLLEVRKQHYVAHVAVLPPTLPQIRPCHSFVLWPTFARGSPTGNGRIACPGSEIEVGECGGMNRWVYVII